MNYRHVIYNSSEKSQTGSVGFGVRCSTEGTNPEELASLESNGLFEFSYVGPNLSIGVLTQNPEAVLELVPTYFFRTISMPGGKPVYALGRKIGVGFDYTYYLNGKAGRLGNYVVDCYVFDEAPTAREFEILLEDAMAGSNHFIPVSPIPNPGNEEMKRISLGHHPTLPVECKPFDASSRPRITPQAIDLLFAYITASKEGKPVLVKSDVKTPPQLMAQLAMLVPQSLIPSLTFTTNHDAEGKKPGINIVFVNQYYDYEIFPKQWVMLDLNTGAPKFHSEEMDMFRGQVENYVAAGDLGSVHKLVAWCSSPLYEKSKSMSPATRTQLYSYFHDYSHFDIDRMAGDNDLKNTLSVCFTANPADQNRLQASLQQRFDETQNLNEMFRWMDLVTSMRPVNLKQLVENNRAVITNNVFEDVDSFLKFYEYYVPRLDDALLFVDARGFARNADYLSSPALNKYWDKLYMTFRPELHTDPKRLVRQMLHDRVPEAMRTLVLGTEIPAPRDRVNVLIDILRDGGEYEDTVLDMLYRVLTAPGNAERPDLFAIFPNRVADPRYRRFYELQLETWTPRDVAQIKAYAQCLAVFLKNGGQSWHKLNAALTNLYALLRDNMRRKQIASEDVGAVCATVINALPADVNPQGFMLLRDVALNKPVSDPRQISNLWTLASEVNADRYLRYLAPQRLKIAETNAMRGNQTDLAKLCDELLAKHIMTHDELIAAARSFGRPDIYYVAMLHHDDEKPKAQLEFLCTRVGMTDDQAMDLLQKYFIDSYEKILKSRQPSAFSRFGKAISGIFSKKDKGGDKKDDEDKDKGNDEDLPPFSAKHRHKK